MDPTTHVPSTTVSTNRTDPSTLIRTQNNLLPAASSTSSNPPSNLPPIRPTYGSPVAHAPSNAVKKKRIPACDTCNSKKIKCDGVRPNCGMCSKNGRACSYERLGESTRGKRPRTDDASDMVQNPSVPLNPAAAAHAVAIVPPGVQTNQQPVAQLPFSNSMPSTVQLAGQIPSSRSSQSNAPVLHSSIGSVSAHQKSQVPSSSRIAQFGGVLSSSRIGTATSNQRPPTLASQPYTPSRPAHTQTSSVSSASNVLLQTVQSSISRPNFSSLPAALVHANQYPLSKPPDPLASLPQDAKNELIGLYFKYIDPMMHILHRQSFHDSKEAESPLLLHTIYAMAARYCKHPAVLAIGALYCSSANGSASTTMEELHARACDAFYFKARDLVDQFMDFPRVSTIAAFCLLKCLCAGSGRVSASWMYSGMAISMLKDLRRTNTVEDDLAATLDALADADGTGAGHGVEWIEREKRRRLWWSCYVGDRYAAVASDRPMILVDTDCKVHFPSNINDWDAGRPIDRETPLSLDFKQRHTLDFASSNAFVPFTNLQPTHSYFLILCKLFGRIIDFTKVYKTATTHPPTAQHRPLTLPADFNKPEIDQQMQILEASLHSWARLLPESLALSNSLTGAELSHFSSPANTLSLLSELDSDKNLKNHLHLFYHISHILVHKPKLMHMLRVLPSSQHHSSIPLQEGFKKSLFHATQITQLLTRVRTTNPHLIHFTPFITCFAIFQSALIHLIRGQVSCHHSDADRSCQDALLHADALKGFSRDWGIAVKLCGSLLALIEAAKEEAVKNSGAKVLCDACVSRGVVTDSSAWQTNSRQAPQQQQQQQPPPIQSSQPQVQPPRLQQQHLQQHHLQHQHQPQQQYQKQQHLPMQQMPQHRQSAQFQNPFQNYPFQSQLPLQQLQGQHQQLPLNGNNIGVNSSQHHQRQISEEVIELHRRDAQFLSHGSLNANSISTVPTTLGSSSSTSSVHGINNWLAGIPDVSTMNHVRNYDATRTGFDVGNGGGVRGVVGSNGTASRQDRQGGGVGGISDIWNLHYIDSASFDMNPGAGSQFFQ
ncbi:fungal-specific transcription factor domain-containing protein [Chytriomyces cf. hyalinus JEL632]|nr:fungal-specific transcription factor domain-containing protein [Chytriomyces cf. hyalinus JEL632]